MAEQHERASVARVPSALGPAARFLAWWAGLFGFVAAGGGSVCPCCGTAGCPVAPAAAGVLGGVAAVLLFLPRWSIRLLGRRPRKAAFAAEAPENPE